MQKIKPNKGQEKLSKETIKSQNLSFAKISLHAKRIRLALKEQKNHFLPIKDACKIDNNGIISWKTAKKEIQNTYSPSVTGSQHSAVHYWRENYCISFIPAAGAASRFLGDLYNFIDEIEKKTPQLKSIKNAFFMSEHLTIKTEEQVKLI
ncbi:MAG: hypothetical protein K2X39_08935, partial [Silvanigrellaceae bacterium]|nr:hypothetical protein [Silvanigrellaceae bacterium]